MKVISVSQIDGGKPVVQVQDVKMGENNPDVFV
jgi:hypothetical protein